MFNKSSPAAPRSQVKRIKFATKPAWAKPRAWLVLNTLRGLHCQNPNSQGKG